MAAFRETIEAVTSANYRSPKTVLGFFAVLVAILASASVLVTGILAREPTLHSLIVPILIFAGAVLLLVLIGIFITAWKDPTILMLSQVSGEVYIQNRKLTLGDSVAGEFSEIVTSALQTSTTAVPTSTEGQ